jgi:hypothetical protein
VFSPPPDGIAPDAATGGFNISMNRKCTAALSQMALAPVTDLADSIIAEPVSWAREPIHGLACWSSFNPSGSDAIIPCFFGHPTVEGKTMQRAKHPRAKHPIPNEFNHLGPANMWGTGCGAAPKVLKLAGYCFRSMEY